MNAVMLLYRTNLPYSVKARPRHIRSNRLAKPLEELQLLLLTEHHLASGHTLELEHEFGSGTPKLQAIYALNYALVLPERYRPLVESACACAAEPHSPLWQPRRCPQ